VEEIQCAVTRELKNSSKTALLEGVKMLKERANKCIGKERMYYEKTNQLFLYKNLSLF
jgi:hypothetical protein